MEGEGEFLSFDLGDDHQEVVSFHRWFAMRGVAAARAAVAFTVSPDWLGDQERRTLVNGGDDAEIAAAIGSRREGPADSLLDLCGGVGTIAAVAARLGFEALSLELSEIPHLTATVLYDFPVSMGAANGHENSGSWRGYTSEVEDFANAVWDGAKERLKELFEEDVAVRIWVRFTECPFCGTPVPVVSNARLSGEAALNIISEPRAASGGMFPRFGLLHTEFPDLKGTFARGLCTCPSCRHSFRFQGHDLISARSVPVAVRMRDARALSEIDSPDAYIRQVETASYDLLSASSRRLGGRMILPVSQPIFHDARGEPVLVRDAFLPRQRAYFAALAESMHAESALLDRRTALTEKQRTAVRTAVALLISGQADFVNTCVHSSIDKPHPSTSAGPLRFGGLFTEVGGFWLEHYWQARLYHLLGLLRANSSAARPVKALRADAGDIPLGTATVSTVIWDPPYYDGTDYDSVAGHYQSVLAAVVPDIAAEPTFQPRLSREERHRRNEADLVQQAREARRVLSPTGSIGVFWPARDPAELERFLELIGPAALQLVHAVRLDTIRTPRAALADQQTYLLVLQSVAVTAPEVPVDADKVLSLAEDGALSLYDGLADLFGSLLRPEELADLIADEDSGPARQRLARFLASQPELEQLLVDHLGKASLLRELVSRGASRDDLRATDASELAQRLLALLGFGVARGARFSIGETLRDCEKAARRLELADSPAAVNEAFLDGFKYIEKVLRYTVFAWAYLESRDQWDEVFEQVVRPAVSSYPGPARLAFGHVLLLFNRLPVTFTASDRGPDNEIFGKIARAIKKTKADQRLSTLVQVRNGIAHPKDDVTPLSVSQLRQKCSTALTEAHAALAELYRLRFLPVTARPIEERKDRYNRRVLRLRDTDDAAIEVYVRREIDLTEPLIYFASENNGRRDINPKFLQASVVEALSGLTGQNSTRGRA